MYRLRSKSAMPYLIAAILSALCSFWISSRELVINPDAICYLQSAASMKDGIHVAMNICGQAKWPFYSLLISAVVHLTHLSYEASAYTLNGLFSLLTVLIFMRITAFLIQKTSYEKNKTLLLFLAAAVILLAHEFNAVKTYIIRDHGFWAFYMSSILFLLYYFRSKKWYYAIAWSVSTLIATLFRIEGGIFLLLIPFLAWFDTSQSKPARLKAFVTLNSLTLLASIVGCIVISIYHPQITGRLYELKYQLVHGLALLQQNFQAKALGLSQAVLGESGARDATPVLFITLIVWYVFNVIANLSVIYSILVCYAWYKKLLTSAPISRLVIWGYVIVNLLITAIFLGQSMFLSKRYLMALSIVLMLWLPVALFSLIKQWRRKKWPLLLVLFFIFISSLGGLFDFGYSKAYLREAGDWLALNVPSQAKLYSNDLQLMYYSKHFGDQIFKQIEANSDSTWKKSDYLAIRSDQKTVNQSDYTHNKFKLLEIFQNKRGDQVRIYRRFS